MDPRWYEDEGSDENIGQWLLAIVLWFLVIALVTPIWEDWKW